MPTFDELDAITLDDLRATGATKWNREDGAIGAFTAEMDFGVAPEITQAVHREVDSGLFAYLPPRFKTEMQQAVAGFLSRHVGWDVPPERIHEMPDVIAVQQAAIEHFSAPGSKVIVPTPAYMPFILVPPMMDREVIEVPMIPSADGTHYVDDLAGIEKAFDDGGGILLLCNPHNPTGRVYTLEELKAIEDLVDRKGGRVFSDEIWLPLVFDGKQHISYASIGEKAAGHTVTATAASKAFNLPGMKCAQLITSNDADQEKWLDVGFLAMHGAANLGLVATAAAFDHGKEWFGDVLAYLQRNRDDLIAFVEQRLPHAKVTHPEGTYVAWLDFSAYDLGPELQPFFIEHAGVMCTEGTACGASGAGHVRFIFAMPHPVMMDALERIARALDDVPLKG